MTSFNTTPNDPNTSSNHSGPETDGSTETSATADASLRRLLIETRAAFNVLVEMNALMYADGDQKEYRETLTALKQRHRQAIQDVEDELFGSPAASSLSETDSRPDSLSADSSS